MFLFHFIALVQILWASLVNGDENVDKENLIQEDRASLCVSYYPYTLFPTSSTSIYPSVSRNTTQSIRSTAGVSSSRITTSLSSFERMRTSISIDTQISTTSLIMTSPSISSMTSSRIVTATRGPTKKPKKSSILDWKHILIFLGGITILFAVVIILLAILFVNRRRTSSELRTHKKVLRELEMVLIERKIGQVNPAYQPDEEEGETSQINGTESQNEEGSQNSTNAICQSSPNSQSLSSKQNQQSNKVAEFKSEDVKRKSLAEDEFPPLPSDLNLKEQISML